MFCPVCIEKLTEKNQIVCHIPACSYTCCKKCVQTYLLTTMLEPHCMHCRTKWNNEFIKTVLGKTFITTQYKTHRANVLANQIIARKEEYLENAALYKENLADKKISAILNAEVTELRRAYEAKYAELDEVRRRISRRNAKIENRKEKEKRVRIFKMPCQNAGCHGMLDSSYFCILCAKKTCNDCLTVIEPNHVCNPDSVATASLIRSTSKPCPKCGERISKIDGCDQMWCVECKTAFSWTTGYIETGTVHNPHYYQWMREHGGMPRTDEPIAGCNNRILDTNKIHLFYGRMNDFYMCYKNALKLNYMKDNQFLNKIAENILQYNSLFENVCVVYKQLTEYNSYIIHITNVVIPDAINSIARQSENVNVIYEYLIGIKSREDFGSALVVKEENEIQINATRDILNATQMVLTQILQTFTNILSVENSELKIFENALKRINLNIEINNNETHYYYENCVKRNKQTIETLDHVINNNGFGIFVNAANTLLNMANCTIKQANKYLAYSNIEQIKILTLHNSKRKLCLWNFEKNTREDIGFKSKGEMQAAINSYSEFL